MENSNESFQNVLKKAQKLGYAEPGNPKLDLNGFDAFAKVRILSSLAFNSKISKHKCLMEGIENIDLKDIRIANQLDLRIKLLGISELKNNSETSFDYMFCQTGIDFSEHIEVLYHLRNTQNNSEIIVKAIIEDRENPAIDSVFDLYKTADFHEREIFDLFGVKFNNHPDLRRILLDDDWEGYPLRKDYVDEVNIVEL